MAKPRVQDPATRREVEKNVFDLMDRLASHTHDHSDPLSPEELKDLGMDTVDEIMELIDG